VDASGSAYVVGTATSANFPVTGGAFLTTNPLTPAYLQQNIYSSGITLTKLSPSGADLSYSTYVVAGSVGSEVFNLAYDIYEGEYSSIAPAPIVVDAGRNAYIAGGTSSTTFPATSGAYQTVNRAAATSGASNAWILKMNPAGAAPVFATYFGGSTAAGAAEDNYIGDYTSGIAIDAADNVYVTGGADSTDFPVTKGAFQTTNNAVAGQPYGGATNAFVSKFDPTGSSLLYSTLFGGSAGAAPQSLENGDDLVVGETPQALALDPQDNVIVTGATVSMNLPTTAAALEPTNPGIPSGGADWTGFVAKFDLAGTSTTPNLMISPTSIGLTEADQTATITISVAGTNDGPTPTGTIAVESDLGDREPAYTTSASLVNGQASFSVPYSAFYTSFGGDLPSELPLCLAVAYTPDAASYPIYNNTQNAIETFVGGTVAAAPNTTILMATPNPADAGAAITFTANVASTASSICGTPTTIPTGTVTFFNGTTSLGSGTVNASGVATFTISTLQSGTHSVTGSYGGDTIFAPTTSAALSVTVNGGQAPGDDELTITGPLQIGSNYTDFGTGPGGPYTPAPGYGTFTVIQSTGDYLSDGIAVGSTGMIQSLNEGTGAVTLPRPFLTFNGAASGYQFVASDLPAGATADPFTLTQDGTSVDATFQVIGTLVNTSTNAQVGNLTLNFVTIFPNTTVGALFNSLPLDGIYNAPAAAATAPTEAVTPSPSSITTTQALSVTVTVGGTPTPTGSVVLTSGSYTSAATTLSSGSATINIPAGSLANGTNTLTATYTPDSTSSTSYNGATGSNTVTVTAAVAPTFTISSTTAPQTIQPGGTAQFTITATAQNGTFPGSVSLAASGLPTGAVATFSPASITPGSSSANSTLSIQIGSTTTATAGHGSSWPFATSALAVFGLCLVPGKRRRRWITMALLLIASLGALTGLTACGGGLALVALSQSYTITVTGTSGTDVQTTTVQLTVQ